MVNELNQQIYTQKEIREMKERGIYTSSDEKSFKSDKQIKRELALKGELPVMTHKSDIKVHRDVYYYLERAKMKGDLMKEMSPRADREVKIHFPRTSILNITGDWHYGHPNCNEDRIKQEMEVIKNTPDSYFAFTGDLVHGIFWGGTGSSEQSATLDEQRLFLAALFDSTKGKVLLGISGEHDSKWAAKSGADPYFDFSERTGAPYIRGIAEVEMTVGEQSYKMVNQHRARGHSMYNKDHPTTRQSRFDLQGADIYTSNHNHRKKVAQEAIRVFGGARMITHGASGAYVSGDEFGDRSGFPKLKPEEMYGIAIRVHADRQLVEIEYDIIEAHKKWVQA